MLEGPEIGLDEARPEEEVLGGISRQAKLGEGDQVDGEGPRALELVQDPAGVALDVADGDVDLREADPELSHADPPSRSIPNRP